jgi:hypothetical protein
LLPLLPRIAASRRATFRPVTTLREGDMVGDLTIGEAARALGVDKNSVRAWPADELPYHRIGRRGDRRYRAVDVAAYAASRREGSGVSSPPAPALAPTVTRLYELHTADRTLAVVTRVLEGAGRSELAGRLRDARGVFADLSDLSDR